MGLLVGSVFALVLGVFQEAIMRGFSNDPATLHCLGEFWWLVVWFQPLNALVFTYDGVRSLVPSSFFFYAFYAFLISRQILYGTQSFLFVRNWLFLGFSIFFVPLTAVGYLVFHSLLGLWVAKACLNAWRCCFAVYRVLFHLFPLWVVEGGDSRDIK